MSILYEASKYKNRKFDVLIMQGVEKTGEHLISMSLFEKGGGICTGIQKLIQRFVLTILTPVGTMQFDPDRGCTFVENVARARNESEIESAFGLAMIDVGTQLRNAETDDMPDDERYESAELLDVSFIGDTVSLEVSLTSAEGTTSNIILPIYA